MSTMSEYRLFLEIDVGEYVYDVTFTANGEYLVSGGDNGVRVWRVKDGELVATMPVTERNAYRVATSRDGCWIAVGSWESVFLWNTKTYKQVWADKVGSNIQDVDFSSNSTRLVLANEHRHGTATIWDTATRQKVQTLDHPVVFSAKYSPQGDRVATASRAFIRVWDSKDGRLLVNVNVGVATRQGLLWHNNHLSVITKEKVVREIDVSTASTVSEWPGPDTEYGLCIAGPQHGRLLACSANKTITFLNTSANTQPSSIQHINYIHSMAFSFDGQSLAIAAGSKITVKVVSSVAFPLLPVAPESEIVVKDPPPVVLQPISEPELLIDNAALDAWKHGQLAHAEALLSAAILAPENKAHYVLLASRALVRARLGQWDTALLDAEESIKIQRSLLAYVAKCVALVGKGEKDEGIRVCDTAFEHFHSNYVSVLLLIKAVVLFMAGDHGDAISRIDNLINDSAHVSVDPALYGVQAYIHLLLGNKHIENTDYERAIRSFEDARIILDNRTCQPPLIVSLISGWRFDDLAITIQQHLCEAFLEVGRTKEAAECMVHEEINMSEPTKTRVSDFKYRCRRKLENLGDSAVNVQQYDEAISQYTAALLVDSISPRDVLAKRSRAYAGKSLWKDALNDADEVIRLDPSFPSGYERKYAALLGIGHHDNAIDVFETMLSKISESSDPDIRERSRHFIQPEQIKEVIRTSISNAIRDSPLVLIDASSGRLCDKSEQAATFESIPAFATLVASMTTHIDHTLIEQVVGDFYRYATFSHTWEGNEPVYEKVIKTVVYDLEAFPTHHKLQMFCKIVRDEGFNWAWSDTCCIDKGDPFALQEALVSMFKWYEGSVMTVIFLCDVDRLAELGALTMSLWNSRGWTLQEYHASKVVRIYTKDWTPYLGLKLFNHKESPEIISEMEKATGISAQSLIALRPGLKDIREKLRLASTRQTTRVEDTAYSLLGIFSMTLPATYGEGDKALGRLLSQLLTSSGDTSILAWTGKPSSFNSCLPADITVFSQPSTSHIPPAIPDSEMATITAMLQSSLLELNLVTRLYDQLNVLPLPLFAVQRMKLPCLAFKIRSIRPFRKGTEVVFRAQAGALGAVDIKTRQNIAEVDSLYLVHPWIDFLLDRRFTGHIVDIAPQEAETFEFDESSLSDSFPELPSTLDADSLDDTESLTSPTEPLMDARMAFLARLRQPFGALLLAPTRHNVPEYKRIATENVITARVQGITSATLNRLIQGVCVLDVL